MGEALGLSLVVLLPGLLVVRAPWTSVPALSLAFWALSPWWTPATWPRSSVLAASLFAFGALFLLRLLPKHEVPPPPGWPGPGPAEPIRCRSGAPLRAWPGAIVAATAVALVAGAPLFRNPPGPRLAFHAAAARLVLWRDGVPLSFEPLLPLGAFGAHAPAVATLAADLARLGGTPPAAAVAAVVLLAAALLLLGLFQALFARWPAARGGRAAVTALASLAAAACPLALAPRLFDRSGLCEAALALGFVLPGAELVAAHRSRSSAVAGAWLLAAALLVDPWLAAAALAGCVALAPLRRVGAVACGTLLLAAPGLGPLATAVSRREALTALAAPDPSLAGALVSAAVAAVLVFHLSRWRAGARALACASAVAGFVLCASVGMWIHRGRLDDAAWRALAQVEETTPPLVPACADARIADWVPGVAGRAVAGGPSWVPAAYEHEWQRRSRTACPPGQ